MKSSLYQLWSIIYIYIYVIISYIPKKHHKSPINMISPSNSTLFISSNSGQVMPRDIEMWIAWALHRSKTPQKGSTAKGSGRPVCAPKALNAWHGAEAHHCWGDFEESKLRLGQHMATFMKWIEIVVYDVYFTHVYDCLWSLRTWVYS
jgi:hypothetical protein